MFPSKAERMTVHQGDLFVGLIPPPEVPEVVVDMFEAFALEIIKSGMPRYSARAILHRMRWHQHIEKGNRDFKCNNNWTPKLARWFMAKHPKHSNFFETRSSPGEHDE